MVVELVALACLLLGQEGASADKVQSPPAHFHHVHLNVTDVDRSLKFYSRVFGAVPVKYNGAVDALFTERSFLLFEPVKESPPSALRSGIWHIGWGGVDVPNEYAWWKRHGVDFHTPPTPLPGPDNHYMYINGPDRELIEINTMGHHRFAHVHLFATDVNETVGWYARHLGQKPRLPRVPKPKGDPNTIFGIWMNTFRCDNVQIIVFGAPSQSPSPNWWRDEPLVEFEPTRGRPIDHIAFSYPQIEPVLERMKADGVEIVQPIKLDETLRQKSFFVQGPDKVLVEIVEAKPIPEGLWE